MFAVIDFLGEIVFGMGAVKGVGSAPPEDPRYNLGRDPYFTDGLRAVPSPHNTTEQCDVLSGFFESPRPSGGLA